MKSLNLTYNKKKAKNRKSNLTLVIKCTLNNILIAAVKKNGDLLFWTSSSVENFKGKQRRSNFAAFQCGLSVSTKLKSLGFSHVNIKFNGINRSRNSIIRSLIRSGLVIEKLNDTTKIPHNGCRVKKKRRK